MLASCATMLNGPTTTFVVHSATPAEVVTGGEVSSDSIRAMVHDVQHIARLQRGGHRFTKYTIEAERSKKPLDVVVTDSMGTYALEHKSRLHKAVAANVINYGSGLIIDLFHPQARFYPDLYVDGGRYATFRQVKHARRDYLLTRRDYLLTRGQTHLTLGLPWTNFFSTLPDALGRRRNNAGFIGMSLGAEYFYADRHSAALEVSGIIDAFLPVLAPIDFSGWHEFNDAVNFSLTHNHHTRYFSFGYGLNMPITRWRYWRYKLAMEEEDLDKPGPLGDKEFTEIHWKLGAAFNVYYKLGGRIRCGVVYRPTFYRFGSSKPWAYEHSISIDLKFNFNLRSPVRRSVGQR
jgi:hypothetical protein